MKIIALILIDPRQGRLGHPARLDDVLAQQPVLQHTLDRAAMIEGVSELVLAVRTADGQPEDTPASPTAGLPCRVPDGAVCRRSSWSLSPAEQAEADAIAAARKWSLAAWRGGIAGMTGYDELLPAGPIARLLAEHRADAAVVVRGDWCCFDPAVADEQLAVYRSAPESLRLVFTQAPPGLTALVVDRSVVEDLAQYRTTVARLLCYNPEKPALDPISRDVCVAVPADVRDRHRRFIYDTPRAADHLRDIAQRLGPAFATAGLSQLAEASLALDTDHPGRQLDRLPQQWTIELTPDRPATGPITPQHHLDLPRPAMDTSLAIDLVQQLGEVGDASVLLGGLGDALRHEDWLRVAEAAADAGVMGIGLETDLLCDPATRERLRHAPVDVVSVRINADTAAVYEQLMGVDGYKTVLEHLQSLHTGGGRFDRSTPVDTAAEPGLNGRGWLVPRLVKVADNLRDMETFFERWTRIMGWAVIEGYTTGGGLIPDQSPVPMQAPRSVGYTPPRHRRKQRLTVLSDGTVTLCAQDWLGQRPLGSADREPLHAIWARAAEYSAKTPGAAGIPGGNSGGNSGGPDDVSPVCPRCADWAAVQQDCLSGATA